jgi:hypothetical protein
MTTRKRSDRPPSRSRSPRGIAHSESASETTGTTKVTRSEFKPLTRKELRYLDSLIEREIVVPNPPKGKTI